jgi:hypothetical protein
MSSPFNTSPKLLRSIVISLSSLIENYSRTRTRIIRGSDDSSATGGERVEEIGDIYMN